MPPRRKPTTINIASAPRLPRRPPPKKAKTQQLGLSTRKGKAATTFQAPCKIRTSARRLVDKPIDFEERGANL